MEIQTDAEKYSDEAVEALFQAPPGVPMTFRRSALLVGARGAGKTLLLRHNKLRHKGVSAYFNLTAEFSSITKQTGSGALTFDPPHGLEKAIPGKASALLGLSLYTKLVLYKGVQASSSLTDALSRCIPTQFLPSSFATMDEGTLLELRRTVASAELSLFESIGLDSPLTTLMTELGTACERKAGPLLLLFDKSDQAVPEAAVPVFEALNQSASYTAVLALRPGYTGSGINQACELASPGDHFDLFHLGKNPRSEAWMKFQLDVASSHFRLPDSRPKLLDAKNAYLLDTLCFLARDSLRFTLKHLAKDISTVGALRECASDEQGFLVSTALSTLPKYFTRGQDFRSLILSIQQETIAESSLRPVWLKLSARNRSDLFDEGVKVDRFLEAGLRCGAFSMIEGMPWSPGVPLREIEVSPLLAWSYDKFRPFIRDRASPIVSVREEDDLRQSFQGKKSLETIFLAYRMDFPASARFRNDLATVMKRNPSFSDFHLTDGHTNSGHKNWPRSVREKIKGSKLVIGDISGERIEVMYEMGFAYGLRRPSIAAVERRSNRQNLPIWLSREQVGSYEDDRDIREIVSSIAQILRDPSLGRARLPLQADPHGLVWLRSKEWASHCRSQFEREVKSRGRHLTTFDTDDLDINALEEACRASLLVALLDGTEADVFVHYVAGAIVASPKVGVGMHKFNRHVVILTADGLANSPFLAKGLKLSEDTVVLIGPTSLLAATRPFLDRYDVWSKSSPTKE